ncbi:penicillin acylase family protein [Pseudahrensia aquimaris]|uniref:Penicillin acylase family protein n=1 Tax=Pseudahrensia aquimaris TaxID=744461 RepID=A0ABW3FK34_9HYPH
MTRLLKWFVGGFLTVVALAALAGIVLFAIATRSVQPLSGEAKIAGLTAPVSVVRDADGIAHIEALTQEDAALALGFTHAQDRLWQMELLRMTGQGRLSEMFGVNEDVQNVDLLLRTLGFLDQSKASISALSPKSQAVLRAYSAGVNAFLGRKTGLAEPSLPPEFLILGHAPEPWLPEHSLVVLKIMALNLSKNMSLEIDRLKLAAYGLTPGEIDDILPYHKGDVPPPLPDLTSYYPLVAPKEKTAANDFSRYAGITQRWLEERGRFASNNWVFSGSRTKSGKPLLANDPHLALNAPSLWYLAHMRWQGDDGKPVNVIGSTIPSVPAVILGRNDHIAWGFTNAGGDAQDVFVEKVKPDDASQYLTPDGWKPFESQEEVIRVKGGMDITFKRKVTRHGPVLPGSYKDHSEVLPPNHVLALAWTGLSNSDRNFDVVSGFATAKSVAEFGAIVEPSVAPMQVMVVADTQGDIGLFAKAALPKRGADNAFAGRAPAPGWLAQYDWQGLVSPRAMPAIVNPANGVLGSANSKFVTENKEPFLTYDWAERFRHERMTSTILNRNDKADMAAMIAGQNDRYSPAMIAVRDRVLSALGDRPNEKARIDGLRAWDGLMSANAPEPLMMTAIFRHALKRILKDDLGPLYNTALSRPAEALIGILDSGGSRNWCDLRTTPRTETCREALQGAWDDAMAELEAAHGSNWKAWRWGSAHIVSNEHQPFGKVFPLNMLFDIERPANGGAYSLQRAKNKLSDDRPYRAVHGAGFRAVYDFEDLNKSVFIQTTGQSGNPFSRFYSSMVDRWVAGEYVTMTTREEDYRAKAAGTWNLVPADQSKLE